ncbi:hypothetical protein JCM10212_007106 [Sporobolomyces blumeae]
MAPLRSGSASRPPTALSAARSTDPSDPGEWLVALVETTPTREVGLAAIHLERARALLTQYTDTATHVKTLNFLATNPASTLVVPPNAIPPLRPPAGAGDRSTASTEATMLVRAAQEEHPRLLVVPVARKFWDEQNGNRYENLTRLSARDHERSNLITTVRAKYQALSAASALFKHLESHGTAFPPKSLAIRFAPFEGTCLIDSDSAKNLELVQNVLNPKSKQHLLGMLDHCFTASGTRLLRSNLLAPSTDPDLIMGRYDVVEELVNSEERLRSLRKALERLKHLDVEKFTSRIIASTSSTKSPSASRPPTSGRVRALLPKSPPDPSAQINQKLTHLLNLHAFLRAVPSLRAALDYVDSSLLRQRLLVLEDPRLNKIRLTVEESVNDDLWAVKEGVGKKRGRGGGGDEDGEGFGKLTKASRLFAIKSERKRLLDVARETYRENLSDVVELQDQLRLSPGLDITLVNAAKGDFLLSCSKEDWEERGREVQRHFTNINTSGKRVQFASIELQKLNARILESILEIHLMSDEILEEIFEDIRGDVACLYRCSEAIALLDMLASFAEISSKKSYIRPELTDTLAIKAGRHPLHEHFRLRDGAFVPNDTYANEATSFQIISGSNMSGKSTLLRQIALLHVMAQVGCFVPATYASFRPVSSLLARLSNDDNIEASLSTFASEMSTMSMILGALEDAQDHDKASLVIVDELGRGTSPEEGIGIAHAIAEEIIRSKATCFFTTHFKELSTTLAPYPNVVSLHLETEVDRSRPDYSLTFHHRLLDGTTPLSHYGLELAKIAKLPDPVIDRAHVVAATLDTLAHEGQVRSSFHRATKRKKELLSLKATLTELADSNQIDPSTLLAILRDLQAQTVAILDETHPDEPLTVQSQVESDPAAAVETGGEGERAETIDTASTAGRSEDQGWFGPEIDASFFELDEDDAAGERDEPEAKGAVEGAGEQDDVDMLPDEEPIEGFPPIYHVTALEGDEADLDEAMLEFE